MANIEMPRALYADPQPVSILCVDDSKTQLEKYKIDLGPFYTTYGAANYEQAIQIISYRQPDLILLDVNLDGSNGLRVLDFIFSNRITADIPVIVVTGARDLETIKEAFMKGAADFVRKPYYLDELILRIHNQTLHIEKGRDFNTIQEEVNSQILENRSILREAKNTTVFALTELAESREDETGSHLKRIKKYTLRLCETLACQPRYHAILTDDYIEDVFSMSALHDIGKVGLPDSILKKEGKLTPDEYDEMKKHAVLGGRILKTAFENNPDCEYLKTGMEIAHCHHEKWTGAGYPRGLDGEQIPLAARLVTIARDVFDALSTKRVYKQAYDKEKVLSIMQSERGATFDPALYDAFFNIRDDFFKITELFNE